MRADGILIIITHHFWLNHIEKSSLKRPQKTFSKTFLETFRHLCLLFQT